MYLLPTFGWKLKMYLLSTFTFTQPCFSKTCWVNFPQPHVTNISIGFVSLGLESLKKYVPHFPWPSRSGSKQNLTCVYFPSVCFLKIYWCSFRSASRHQHIYDSFPLTCVYFPPPPNPKPKTKTRSVSQNPI